MSYIAGWAALGVLLLILEALFVGGFFLSFATSALLMSVVLYFYSVGFIYSLVTFALVGLVLVYPWKVILERLHKNQTNINDY
jgi:membrane protein implicated in regulation of membrane protease activity